MTTDEIGIVPDGVSMIMVTPFDDQERVDTASLAKLTNWAVDQGVTSVVPLAIMGEAHRLAESERRRVLETVVATADGRIDVVAGCTSESTFVAVERAREAVDAGANSLMLAPARNIAVGPAVFAHYRAVAEAADSRPIVVQDEPVTTGVKMPAAFIAELSSISNITHVKVEESPSAPKLSAILAENPELRCFGGLGGLYTFEEMSRGAIGVMTGFAAPAILVEIISKFQSGQTEAARAVFYHYLPLIRYEAQLGVGGVSIRKQLLFERGLLESPAQRKPGAGVDEQSAEELREIMRHLDIS